MIQNHMLIHLWGRSRGNLWDFHDFCAAHRPGDTLGRRPGISLGGVVYPPSGVRPRLVYGTSTPYVCPIYAPSTPYVSPIYAPPASLRKCFSLWLSLRLCQRELIQAVRHQARPSLFTVLGFRRSPLLTGVFDDLGLRSIFSTVTKMMAFILHLYFFVFYL